MNIVIPKPVNEVLNIINEKGYEAYLVGGAVRNWVMDLKPSNYVNLPADKEATFLKMIDLLEDNDDVQEVYHNVELSEE